MRLSKICNSVHVVQAKLDYCRDTQLPRLFVFRYQQCLRKAVCVITLATDDLPKRRYLSPGVSLVVVVCRCWKICPYPWTTGSNPKCFFFFFFLSSPFMSFKILHPSLQVLGRPSWGSSQNATWFNSLCAFSQGVLNTTPVEMLYFSVGKCA